MSHPNEARALELSNEVFALSERLARLDSDANASAALITGHMAEFIAKQFGPLANLPRENKLRIAQHLRAQVGNAADDGQRCGLRLLAAFVEAHALTGDEARFLCEAMKEIVVVSVASFKDARNRLH